ncbi:spliceosome RNA helicase DDX39B-like [Prionailurus bengalensis]|uniref:spliceosome RNA helicase DDX39B-like n=1 Tax=Prionailurus bengalensis TaxID=37029 RepID=UPI001CA94070|nr:spliceosome RNA helicase DDX39B-like [Prionailurus bengalensis]
MDIKQVNSAINYHRPGDSHTYLHRVSCTPTWTSHCTSQSLISYVFIHYTLVPPFGCLPTLGSSSATLCPLPGGLCRPVAITFVSSENNAKILSEVQGQTEVDGTELPDEMDVSSSIAAMGEDALIHRV